MIIELVNEIIKKYYHSDDNCYTAHRYDSDDNEIYLKDELLEMFANHSISFRISEIDGYDSSGFSEDFMALSFLDENNELQLISLIFEYY